MEFEIDHLKLKKAGLVIKAINHKFSLQILQLVHANQEMPVSEMYSKLRLAQPVASNHLAILHKAGFVTTKREGKFVYYSIYQNRLKEMDDLCRKILNE